MFDGTLIIGLLGLFLIILAGVMSGIHGDNCPRRKRGVADRGSYASPREEENPPWSI